MHQLNIRFEVLRNVRLEIELINTLEINFTFSDTKISYQIGASRDPYFLNKVI